MQDKPQIKKDKTDNDEEYKRNFLRAYGIYGGIGFQLAASVVVGVLFGRYLDEKLETHPLFLIIGVLLGSFAGFYTMYKMLKYYQNRQQNGDE